MSWDDFVDGEYSDEEKLAFLEGERADLLRSGHADPFAWWCLAALVDKYRK